MTVIKQQDTPKRQERAHRILDAAAELILRWGYNKTTIDDIAQQAGVGKGTIYLHWKTREALFRALILREQLAIAEEFKQGIMGDPVGVTLGGIYKHTALALLRRPLMKAIMLGDTNVLGRMAHAEHQTTAFAQRLAGFNVYLEFMREHSLVRSDLSLETQVYTISAIVFGFFVVDPLMPDSHRLPNAEVAELIGETIHRTLEVDRPILSDEYRILSQKFIAYVDQMLEVGYQRFEQEMNGTSANV